MSHEPPVPPGNTSPYPSHEPPHPPAPPKPPEPPEAETVHSSGWPVAAIIGAVATVGAVALGAVALLLPAKPAPRKKRRAKRKP